MNYNQRCLISGKTRSGKSTFARYLFLHFTGCRRILVNIKGRLDIGVEPTYDVAAIDWSAPVVNFVPRSYNRDLFAILYAEIWRHRNVPTIVWTDECAAVTSANYAPDGVLLIQQQGGELDVGHIAVAQRLKNVKMELRTEADYLFIFSPPASQADLEWLAEEIGDLDGEPFTGHDLRRRLRDLPAYGFLMWDRTTGELVDCEPLHAGWVQATFEQVAATSDPPSAETGEQLQAAHTDEGVEY